MSYNGSGTFVINSAGQPVVSGTVITSTAFNALTADLGTGLSTAITKDGQTTPTANIPLGGFKITNLGAGTVASDAARLSQVQNSTTTTLISITGTDTITGTVSPALTAYATGQVFSFVVAATNTGAVTLNIDSQGAKAITRTGAVALVAGDLVTGQVAVVEYDGTRFQLLNGNSFTNLNVSGTLGVTGATTLSSTLAVTGITTVAAGTAALPSIISTTGTSDTGQWFPAADTIAWSTAGSERARASSTGNFGIGTTSPTSLLHVSTSASRGGSTGGLINAINTNTSSSQSPVGYFESSSDTGWGAMYLYAKGIRSGANPAMHVVMDGTGGSYQIIFNNGNGSVGSISTSGSTTTYNTLSDYRLKNTIKPMTGALDKVALLKPVTYKWNADGLDGQGFIAHELQEIVPDCVTGKKDATIEGESGIVPIYQAVDTSYLVATLTAAIQEQQAIIETLKSRITSLENK